MVGPWPALASSPADMPQRTGTLPEPAMSASSARAAASSPPNAAATAPPAESTTAKTAVPAGATKPAAKAPPSVPASELADPFNPQLLVSDKVSTRVSSGADPGSSSPLPTGAGRRARPRQSADRKGRWQRFVRSHGQGRIAASPRGPARTKRPGAPALSAHRIVRLANARPPAHRAARSRSRNTPSCCTVALTRTKRSRSRSRRQTARKRLCA